DAGENHGKPGIAKVFFYSFVHRAEIAKELIEVNIFFAAVSVIHRSAADTAGTGGVLLELGLGFVELELFVEIRGNSRNVDRAEAVPIAFIQLDSVFAEGEQVKRVLL